MTNVAVNKGALCLYTDLVTTLCAQAKAMAWAIDKNTIEATQDLVWEIEGAVNKLDASEEELPKKLWLAELSLDRYGENSVIAVTTTAELGKKLIEEYVREVSAHVGSWVQSDRGDWSSEGTYLLMVSQYEVRSE